MKARFLLLTLFFVSFHLLGFSQEDPKNPYDVNFKVNYDQEAHYPAGAEAFYAYIYKNITYTDEAKQKMISGDVLVSFDVMPDSTVSNIIILSSPGCGVDEEINRLIAPLKFAPAMAKGTPMRQNMMMSIPVRAGVGSK